MTIEDIEQKELTAGEREVLARDRERWKLMGGGSHLDEWLAFGPGLMLRRRLAMRLAFANRPEGRSYGEAYGQLMRHDGIDTNDKSAMGAMTAVLWLHDEPERMVILREIRDAMTPGERARLNSPITARQRVEKIIKTRTKAREQGLTEQQFAEEEAKDKQSPLAKARAKLAECEREIAKLKARQSDGSLFDLKADDVQAIAEAIAANVSEGKANALAKAIPAAVKERKRKREAPAG